MATVTDAGPVEARTRPSGKHAARSLRRAGEVPAVVYGHGEPVSITLSAEAARRVLALPPNRVFALNVQGEGAGTQEQQVRLKAVSHEATTSRLLHLDLQRVLRGERLTASVPIRVQGDGDLLKRGLLVEHLLNAVEVEAEADRVPEHVDVDVSSLDAGEARTVGDLTFPAGVTVLSPPDAVVVHVAHAQAEAAQAEATPTVAAEGGEPGA
jgi:large subunit ribosomal protein L25